MTVNAHVPVLGLAAILCRHAVAATFTVSFDPAAPALTNGWNLGQTAEQKSGSATQPGGRKFAPTEKGDTLFLESPVYDADIRAVALFAWGSGINAGNASRVTVYGRANAASAYVELFSRTGLANTLAQNEPEDHFAITNDIACRQLKIAYTKDKGTWILAKVTITDDAIRAETPTSLHIETIDAAARRVRVTWDMPDGVTESDYRTFTTVSTGGLSAVPAEKMLWRRSFADVPASKTRVLSTAELAALGLGDWETETVRQTTVAGALLIGWEKHASGSLTTPPLGADIPDGSTLVLRAAKHETKSGVLPVYARVGDATSCVATVAIDQMPRDAPITLPALTATDRLIVHSATNTANEKTLVYDLAICAPNAYVAEGVATNAPTAVQALAGNAVELIVPPDGTNLYLEVRTRLGTEASAWASPFPITLVASDAGGDANGNGGETGNPPGTDALAAPARVCAGRLADGLIRLGWESPAGATNVQIRIWSRTVSGGLAEAAADDVLWRETFSAAPATNSTIALDKADKWDRYTDCGANGWAWETCSAVYLAAVVGALRIGKSDSSGTLATRPLGCAGEGLTLVVSARRAVTSAGTDLHATFVAGDGTTNTLAEATLTDEFVEHAWPLGFARTASDTLVLGSPTKKKDGRMLVSDIALVRAYTPVSYATNDCLTTDLGPTSEFDWTPTDEAGLFVSLRAQDANGRESPWSEPFALEPTALDNWHDRHVTMTNETANVLFRPEDLPKTDKGRDLSTTPFRGILQGEEVFALNNRDATRQLSSGLYVCTNVFARDWAVLVPSSPANATDVRDAELRLAVRTGDYAARHLEVSGVFAQLNATNTQEKALCIQWRQIAPDGTAGEWAALTDYKSTYTATNATPDLAATVSTVTGAADFHAPRGATVEARVYCRKENDSGREAPLGFRDFRVRVFGKGPSLLFVIR